VKETGTAFPVPIFECVVGLGLIGSLFHNFTSVIKLHNTFARICHMSRCFPAMRVVVVVVVVVIEMNIIKVALSHCCCRTTVQSHSVSVGRQVTVRRW